MNNKLYPKIRGVRTDYLKDVCSCILPSCEIMHQGLSLEAINNNLGMPNNLSALITCVRRCLDRTITSAHNADIRH